jgi:hypothetical protein
MSRSIIHALAVWIAYAAAATAADTIPRPEHPRPEAVRERWVNLNGTWKFRFDPQDVGVKEQWNDPAAAFDREIIVPFCWESELSGIKDTKYHGAAWYRRSFEIPANFAAEDRVFLRFEAVDWRADVWVNGKKVAEHEGGYTPFSADVTDAIQRHGQNTVVVRVFDPTDPDLPTGKQVGWYTSTSGIWQTVWLEARPASHIDSFTIKTKIDPAEAAIEVVTAGSIDPKATLTAYSEDSSVRSVKGIAVDGNKAKFTLKVDQPKLWTPETPHLYPLTLELKSGEGRVDTVRTYFALRTISRGKYGDAPFERILLNGKPVFLRGALDQSFNPKGIYTAPDEAFLKHDIELAKSVGLNMLRIHIKPDEPRRLYWADKLGMMILEDMPNTWRQNEKARTAWERTMREVVARDHNHPAIIAWVDFNETWGLGRPDLYKASKDTQEWVRSMVALTRSLDDTRLVEDNSPCNYDHVEGTDLNSWHFYIDEHEGAKRHIDEVVSRSEPGSAFNYCPGQKMNSAPLINSEYGGVSAGGGDRDVSWAFRDLTTLLRKQAKIQGYVYTELSDIEWEHNGFFDYDRGKKEFGYEAFVPGMTPADLQGADFIGFDAPPAIVAKVNELIPVPLFVSHYSDLKETPTLRWSIKGTDDKGETVEIPARTRPVEWVPFGVKEQKRIAFRIETPFVGAVGFELVDASGKRIAANFVNLVVKPEKPTPKVERLDDREVAIRFDPAEFAQGRFSDGVKISEGKAQGRGVGSFTYRLNIPKAVVKARPQAVRLLVEASARAGRDQVDWNERKNPQDNPQTDERKHPTTVAISINGGAAVRIEIADDPADARGVLSHLARVDHGSHGEMIQINAPIPESAIQDLESGKPLVLRFEVPEDGKRGGLAIFGADTGAYPFDPTLVITTRDDLPVDLGVKPNESVTVDTPAARRVTLLPAGDSTKASGVVWSYTLADPGPDWFKPDFDASKWRQGKPGFGVEGTPAVRVGTVWDTETIWLRTTFECAKPNAGDVVQLHLFHDEDVEIYLNGERIHRARGFVSAYEDVTLDQAARDRLIEGRNVIAVRCRQTGGGQGIDVGVSMIRDQ